MLKTEPNRALSKLPRGLKLMLYIKRLLQNLLTTKRISKLRELRNISLRYSAKILFPYYRFVQTPINLLKNAKHNERKLEIGPGDKRIRGFETINIVWGKEVDYIGDASKRLPFSSNVFDVVYGSHILEHIPWYQLESSLVEWKRVTKPGGKIEVWVPNGLLIAETFINAETCKVNEIDLDGWYKFNDKKDPCLWANGRIFSYGDGTGRKGDPNWHLAMFSPRFLESLFKGIGLVNVRFLDRSEIRGFDHGWINLGICGSKP